MNWHAAAVWLAPQPAAPLDLVMGTRRMRTVVVVGTPIVEEEEAEEKEEEKGEESVASQKSRWSDRETGSARRMLDAIMWM